MSVHTIASVVKNPWRQPRFLQEWDALVSTSAWGAIPQTPTWLRAWCRYYGEGCQPHVLAIREGETLVGVAPLVSRRRWSRGIVPLRSLEWMGTGEAEKHEVCSEYVGAIASAGREQEVADAVVACLANGPLAEFDELRLPAMDGNAPITQALEHAFRAGGLPLELVREVASHYVPLPASFDDYLASLSSSKRARLRRASRKFASQVGTPQLARATTPDALTEARHLLEDLHAQRWREQGSEGVFASPLFRSFHAAVLPELIQRERVEICVMRVDARPIAVIYNIICNGRIHFYQSGRSMDLPADVSPGIVIHSLAIESAIARGFREYDFLAGDTRYKRDMALATRPLQSFRYARTTLRSQVAGGIEEVARLAKHTRSRLVALKSQVQGDEEKQSDASDQDEGGVQ